MIIKAESDKAMFLMSNKGKSNCLGIRITMKGAIDGAMLQQAVNKTMERYSYLNVRLVEKFKPYYVENNEPYTVKEEASLPELGGPETAYHLLAFRYYGKTITVYFFHGLVDGGGIFSIVRTLVFYYSKLRYDSSLPSDGIVTLETPVSPDEMADSYEVARAIKLPAGAQKNAPKEPKLENIFALKDSKLITPDDSSEQIYYIKVSAKEMMEACHRYDMTPATLTSLLVARSIRALHPEAENITGGLSMSLRKALNCQTLRNSIVPMTIAFTRDMSQATFQEQCISCRSQVRAHTEKTTQLILAKNFVKMLDFLKFLPYTSFTKKLLAKMLGKIMHETFQVSYVGESRLGAADKYVDSILIDYQMPITGISVEMTAISDSIFLCYGQKWKEDVYLKAFLEELRQLNISPIVIEQKKPTVPAFFSVK